MYELTKVDNTPGNADGLSVLRYLIETKQIPLETAIDQVYKVVVRHAQTYRSEQNKLVAGAVLTGLIGFPTLFPLGIGTALIVGSVATGLLGWQQFGTMRDRLGPEYAMLKQSILLQQFIKYVAVELKKRSAQAALTDEPQAFNPEQVTVANLLQAYEQTVFSVAHGEHLDNNASDPILGLYVVNLRSQLNALPSWVMESFRHLEQTEAQRSAHVHAANSYMFGNLSANPVPPPQPQAQLPNQIGSNTKLHAIDVPSTTNKVEGEQSLGKLETPLSQGDSNSYVVPEKLHNDELINQLARQTLAALATHKAYCDFEKGIDGPKFVRLVIRAQATTKPRTVVQLQDTLFSELGKVIPTLKKPPLVTQGQGGSIRVDVAKAREQWKVIRFWDHIQISSKNYESPIEIPIGVDLDGNLIKNNLSADNTRSVLIGGSPGGGKSNFSVACVCSLVCQYSPDTVKLALSDVKRVEFKPFQTLPHLFAPVATTVKETIELLQEVEEEMDRRLKIIEEADARNIDDYNAKVPENQRLCRVVIFIEELAEIVLDKEYDSEFNRLNGRFLAFGRALGFIPIGSTQTPRVEIIPPKVRTLYSSFMAFMTTRPEESKIVLGGQDESAVNLLGDGDGIFQSNLGSERVQTLFITRDEVNAIVKGAIATYGPRMDKSKLAILLARGMVYHYECALIIYQFVERFKAKDYPETQEMTDAWQEFHVIHQQLGDHMESEHFEPAIKSIQMLGRILLTQLAENNDPTGGKEFDSDIERRCNEYWRDFIRSSVELRKKLISITPEKIKNEVSKILEVERLRLEIAATLPHQEEIPENLPIEPQEANDVTRVTESSTFADFQQIKELRSGEPRVGKKEIFSKYWKYHTTDYAKANQRYLEAIEAHGEEWILELYEEGLSVTEIVSRVWCARRNDGDIFGELVAKTKALIELHFDTEE
jgi:hypothetical protein